MKKLLSLVIALVMLIALAVPTMAAATTPTAVNVNGATVSASVEKFKGSKDTLTITINATNGDTINQQSSTIDNNAAGTYNLGDYQVYVDTKGNTKIKTCYFVAGPTAPAGPAAPATMSVTVNFKGVEGVTVKYYVNGDWLTSGTFDDTTGSINIPVGTTSVEVIKGGMWMQFDGPFTDNSIIDVPVSTITVIGVVSTCSLGIVQNDWVYSKPADIGVPNVFNVFANGEYYVYVDRGGYNEIHTVGYPAGSTVYLDNFYNITIPSNVSNIKIANANWVDSTVWYAYYLQSNVITLMKNNTDAKLYFDYNGNTYEKDFTLDGTNPFEGLTVVNFPGVDGVSIQYKCDGGWKTYTGTYKDTTGLIALPASTTFVQVQKGGMSYTFGPLSMGRDLKVLDVPLKTINVYGIAAACELGVYQGYGWVYSGETAKVGTSNFFKVFDNGGTYAVTMQRYGFSSVQLIAVPTTGGPNNPNAANWQLQAYFNHFYQITVPTGFSNVGVYETAWAVSGAKAGDKITLVKDGKNAEMSYDDANGHHNMTFTLDGTNPFPH